MTWWRLHVPVPRRWQELSRQLDINASGWISWVVSTWIPSKGPRSWKITLRRIPRGWSGLAFRVRGYRLCRTWLPEMMSSGLSSWSAVDKTFGVLEKSWMVWSPLWEMVTIWLGSGHWRLLLDGSLQHWGSWKGWQRNMDERSIPSGLMDASTAWSGKAYQWERHGRSWRPLGNYGYAWRGDVREIMNMRNAEVKQLKRVPTTLRQCARRSWRLWGNSGMTQMRGRPIWWRTTWSRPTRSWSLASVSCRRTRSTRFPGQSWTWRQHLLERNWRPWSRWWWEYIGLRGTLHFTTWWNCFKPVVLPLGLLSWPRLWFAMNVLRQVNLDQHLRQVQVMSRRSSRPLELMPLSSRTSRPRWSTRQWSGETEHQDWWCSTFWRAFLLEKIGNPALWMWSALLGNGPEHIRHHNG